MSKRKRHRQGAHKGARSETSAEKAAPPVATPPLVVLALALAAAGIALTGYLTWAHWFGAELVGCGVDSGCDVVRSSRFATLFGLPLALWGLGSYAGIGALVWRSRRRASSWRGAALLAVAGTGLSVYFTVIGIIELEATCTWCLGSAALMTALAVTLLLARPSGLTTALGTQTGVLGLCAAAVLAGFLQLHWSGLFDPAAGPEDPWLRGLAEHLAENGAQFYGAYWCPHCQEQKEMFGSSAKRLPYVECSPAGRQGPQATACKEARIRSYPSWTFGAGPVKGIQKPDALARRTGYPPRADG